MGLGLGLAILLIGSLLAFDPGLVRRAEPAGYSHWSYLPLLFGPAGIRSSPLAYGASVSNLDNARAVSDLGFGWLKAQLKWSSVQPSPSEPYNWADLDNILAAAEAASLKVLLRVDGAPVWTHTANPAASAPPVEASLAVWGDFLAALTVHADRRIRAYEIWNEPNLSIEWGGQSPSPTYYTRLLQTAYQSIKAVDPSALVVTAGLATTGGDGGATAMDDVAFIRAMYAAGAKGFFDVLGSHPYGFASSPDQLNPNGVTHFRRAADQYQVMVEQGDGRKQVWATEFGWLLTAPCDWPDRNWQKVSEQDQASYLVRAHEVARTEWPWMGAMFVFNLDFATVPWYQECDPIRYYSLLNPSGSPRQAYTSLMAMPK